MTEWILVVMMCHRSCVPVHAVVYPSEKACKAQAAVEDVRSALSADRVYCVPKVIK